MGDIKDIEEMIKKEEVYTDILNDIYDIYNRYITGFMQTFNMCLFVCLFVFEIIFVTE